MGPTAGGAGRQVATRPGLAKPTEMTALIKGSTAPVNFKPFESAYQALTDKLRPQVFSLGFLS
jgi:hypothetical protein